MSGKPHRLRTLDLFSGIGGFALGLRSVCRTVGFCEKDERCKRVLLSRMRDGGLDRAPIYPDITTLMPESVTGRPVMVTAGFPCQDIAVTNYLGKGLSGPRSGLIWPALKLIGGLAHVKYVLLENSPNIRNHGEERLLASLKGLGFTVVRTGVFSARDVGAPHLRKRWYCFACKMVLKIHDVESPPNVWSSNSPVQLIGCSSIKFCRELRHRAAQLGNAVIPQTVLLAFLSLSQDTQYAAIQPRALELTISDGRTTYHRQSWNSPCGTYRLWFPVRLSERSSRVLIVQLIHDRNNIPLLKSILASGKGGKVSVVTNPEFVEWMCGYPRGWTAMEFTP